MWIQEVPVADDLQRAGAVIVVHKGPRIEAFDAATGRAGRHLDIDVPAR